jgi:hypothetical protein
MAVAVRANITSDDDAGGPTRGACASCFEPVLIVVVRSELVLADPFEWQPLGACFVCSPPGLCAHCKRELPEDAPPGTRYCSDVHRKAAHRARKRGETCSRCGGTGLVGSRRPPGPMLAIDVAWSDEGHVRVIARRTSRRRGEGLYPLHVCTHVATG